MLLSSAKTSLTKISMKPFVVSSLSLSPSITFSLLSSHKFKLPLITTTTPSHQHKTMNNTLLRCYSSSSQQYESPSSPLTNTNTNTNTTTTALSGEVHVIVGPMFAGKTTSLLRRVQSERLNGRSVALIKSNKDTRYELNSVVTHDGDKYPCLALQELSSFRQKFGYRAYDELDVIGIDEAQFFDDLYDFCRRAADHDGKTIIVAGLDGDYLRRSFGSVLDIIPLADSVTKLTARCELCGKRAHFTLRKTDEMQTELIGGAEAYMPVCRQHYVSGQGVIEAARMVLQQKVQCG